MKINLFTAIISVNDGTFRKYRNIKNFSNFENEFYNIQFLNFAKSINAICINLYNKESKQFFKQIKIK
jgi:hypothetical protein